MLVFLALLAATSDSPSRDLQAAIKESVGKQLADPFSAQYDWQPVKDDMLYCGWVNAKNSFGAYTGYQPFMVLYFTGNKSGKAKVVDASMTPTVVSKMCLDKGYRLTR